MLKFGDNLQNAGVWLRVENTGDERVIEIGIG